MKLLASVNDSADFARAAPLAGGHGASVTSGGQRDAGGPAVLGEGDHWLAPCGDCADSEKTLAKPRT